MSLIIRMMFSDIGEMIDHKRMYCKLRYWTSQIYCPSIRYQYNITRVLTLIYSGNTRFSISLSWKDGCTDIAENLIINIIGFLWLINSYLHKKFDRIHVKISAKNNLKNWKAKLIKCNCSRFTCKCVDERDSTVPDFLECTTCHVRHGYT